MPNWCSNTLTITGHPDMLKKLMNSVAGKIKDGDKIIKELFDFNKIIPMPATETDWYQWHCMNWGTKWNACETSRYKEFISKGELVYHFDTAWGPPEPVIIELIKLWPKLKFKMRSEEPGMGFGCDIHGSKGSATVDEYNIKSACCPYCGQHDNYPEGDQDPFTCEGCENIYWAQDTRNLVYAVKNGLDILYTLDGDELEVNKK